MREKGNGKKGRIIDLFYYFVTLPFNIKGIGREGKKINKIFLIFQT